MRKNTRSLSATSKFPPLLETPHFLQSHARQPDMYHTFIQHTPTTTSNIGEMIMTSTKLKLTVKENMIHRESSPKALALSLRDFK